MSRSRLTLSFLLVVAAFARPLRAQCLDWAPGFELSGDGLNGEIQTFLTWNDGGGPALFAAGSFDLGGSRVGRWDGTSWTGIGDPLNNQLRSLALFDDGGGTALYVGGGFFPTGTSSARGIAKLVGSTWTAFTDSPDGGVHAMAVFDDGSGPALFVGGNFTTIGASGFDNVAKWDGVSWSALGTGTDGPVNVLQVFDDGGGPELYVGGNFFDAGGTPVVRVAKWDGSAWSAVGSLADVEDFEVFDSGGGARIHAGGPVAGVRRWDGTSWQALGTLSSASSLAVHDEGSGPSLYASSNGQVNRWNGSGWIALGSGPQGFVEALASYDAGSGAKLYAGGSFTICGGRPASHVDFWSVPCSAPVVVVQPVDQVAVFNDPVVFSLQAAGTMPITYRWRKDGTDLQELPGQVEGVTTPSMSIYTWDFDDAGTYDCRIQNSIGTVMSDPATLTVPAGGNTGAPIELQRILAPPQPVPNVPGATYTGFSSPIESSTGEVVVYASITGLPLGSTSINLWSNGSIELLYKNYDPAPGTPAGVLLGGPNANAFTSYLAGAGGRVAFSSQLSGPGVDGTNNAGIWYHDASGGDLVVRRADPIAGVPGTTVRQLFNPGGLSDSGRVAFHASLNLSGSYFAEGIWTWERGSGQALVALTGQSAPGTSDDFTQIEESTLTANRAGDVAFVAQVTGGDWGIWAGDPGALQLVVRSGGAVPGGPAGSTFQTFNYPVLNEAGDLAFQSFVQLSGGATRRNAYRWSAGTITAIAIEDDPAPDTTGETFAVPRPVDMNDSGDVLFYSSLHDNGCTGSCPQYGYFILDSIGLGSVVMNRTDPLPEAPPGFVFDGVGPAALNESGQVVVSLGLAHGSAYGAVYGWTRDHGLFPVVVPGSQIEVDPSEFKTVMGGGISSALGGAGSAEGPSTSLSDFGHTTLILGFTDFTGGIYSGRFTGFAALYFPPGEPFCAGDGSLPTPCPCGNTGFTGRGCQNSAGTGGAVLTSQGGASLTADTVVLTSAGERPTSLSIFLQGTTNLGGGVNYGDGVRCVGGTLKRIAARNAVNGTVTYPLEGDVSISARSAALGNPIVPGTIRYYQTYYRDPAPSFCPNPPGNTFNVSSGQIIEWFP